MPEKHAILSASASARWLACPPSARLEAQLPEQTSSYAEEGTRAHAVAEKRLKHYLKTGQMYKNRLKDVDAEMWEATGRYVDICIEKISEARTVSPDAEVHVEHQLDFGTWVPGGFGTGDMVIVSDKYIEVVDLKYGKGVPVSAAGNTQMRLYALGAYSEFGYLYGAEQVRMTIVQPRLDAVSTKELSAKELLAWGHEVVGPTARLAWDGKGEKAAGDHCRFCRARATCRTLADYELKGVQEDIAASDLTEPEIADIILRAGSIRAWLSDVESYALGQALDGKAWPGLKLVAGRSIRKIQDAAAAAKALEAAGYAADDIYKAPELKTITALEKLVGKKKLPQVLGNIITKPPGKPTLVSESDKRQALALDDIKADFDDELIQ